MEGSHGAVVVGAGGGAAAAPAHDAHVDDFAVAGAPAALEFKTAFAFKEAGDVLGMVAVPQHGQVMVYSRRTMVLWRVDTQNEGYVREAATSIAGVSGFVTAWYLPAEDVFLAVENHTGGCITVYRRADLMQTVRFDVKPVESGLIVSAALHTEKVLLVTGDATCTLRVWSVRPSPPPAHNGPPPPPYRVALQRSITAVSGVATALCVDEAMDRVFGFAGGEVHCWDLQGGLLEWVFSARLPSHAVQLEWAPRAQVLVARDMVGAVRVWGGPLIRGAAYQKKAATFPANRRVWAMQLPGSASKAPASAAGAVPSARRPGHFGTAQVAVPEELPNDIMLPEHAVTCTCQCFVLRVRGRCLVHVASGGGSRGGVPLMAAVRDH